MNRVHSRNIVSRSGGRIVLGVELYLRAFESLSGSQAGPRNSGMISLFASMFGIDAYLTLARYLPMSARNPPVE